jgi:uncharacterized membrane protein
MMPVVKDNYQPSRETVEAKRRSIMAKKNNVVIAYYPDADKASDAADQLKSWDKDDKDVKLGGIAILTEEDGKLKTHKVGTRDAGKGAAWGTAIGATAAVLTGGATLVGGALVGAAGGGVVGALFHKGIGLSDDDKAGLEKKLKDGGAAVVTMTADADVKAAQTELNSLGGDVDSYKVPDDSVQKLDDVKDVPPPDTSDDDAGASE